jgi:hypothetical protein
MPIEGTPTNQKKARFRGLRRTSWRFSGDHCDSAKLTNAFDMQMQAMPLAISLYFTTLRHPLYFALHLPRARADAFLPLTTLQCGWGFFFGTPKHYIRPRSRNFRMAPPANVWLNAQARDVRIVTHRKIV